MEPSEAIRGEKRLSAAAKRHLIGLIKELRIGIVDRPISSGMR